MQVSTVGELREFLSRYGDDAPLECQAVGEERGVFGMFLHVHHGEECGFKWNPQPAILQLKHPSVKVLIDYSDVRDAVGVPD